MLFKLNTPGMDLTTLFRNFHPGGQLAVVIACMGIGLPSIVSADTSLLRCEISQGGATYIEDFLPNTDPYSVEAKDINGQFQFKAVVMGTASLVESIKIYTYYRQQHQVVLLHEARYLPPFNQDTQNNGDDQSGQDNRNPASYAALTGVNYLYSPEVEQELQYGCALLERSR